MIRAIGLAFSALIFAVYMINIKWGWDVTKWSQNMGVSQDDRGEVTVQPIPENPFLSLLENMKPEAAPFQSQTAQETTQKVSVSRMIRFEDVLAEGERRPDPALHAVYVEARAPQILTTLCEDVIQTVGTKCRVLQSSSSAQKEDYFRIKADLTYVPLTTEAQPVSTRDLLTNAIRVSTKLAPLNSSEQVRDTPRERQRLLAKADRICAEVRATFGNCTLYGVTISSSFNTRKDEKQRFANNRATLRVSMQIAVRNQLPDDRTKIQAFLDRQAGHFN